MTASSISSRPRPIVLVAALSAVTGVIGVLGVLAGSAGSLLPPASRAALFSPAEADGYIRDGAPVTLSDDHLPAIARLDAALLSAMRAAESAAADDAIRFDVTSGWRSIAYQQWLLDTRIAAEGEASARAFVATPQNSRHVGGDAVDIGSVDAQYWLIAYGSAYGICQTYANEPWHFELATEPGGACPPMRTDATG